MLPGGGCVVGPVNEEGALTGDNIAYLYPDFHTALLGHFSDGQLARSDHNRGGGEGTEGERSISDRHPVGLWTLKILCILKLL